MRGSRPEDRNHHVFQASTRAAAERRHQGPAATSTRLPQTPRGVNVIEGKRGSGRCSNAAYLTKAHERLDDRGDEKLLGLLRAGDPRGEVRMAWHAKEVIRSIYEIDDPDLAAEFVALLGERPSRRIMSPRGQLPRSNPEALVRPHRCLASGTGIERTHRSGQQSHQNGSRGSGSDSAGSATTESELCSTPGDPTGNYSPQSHPTEIR